MDESSGRPMAARGAAWRRRQRRLRSMLRHERQTVAMALAESLHHSAQRQKTARAGEWVREEVHGEVPEAPTPQEPGTQYFHLDDYDSVPELGGSRPDRLAGVRPQERVPRHIVEQIVDSAPVLPLLHAPVPQTVDSVGEVLKILNELVPDVEQVIDVPKIPWSSRLSYRRFVDFLRQPQTAEQLVEVLGFDFVFVRHIEGASSIAVCRAVGHTWGMNVHDTGWSDTAGPGRYTNTGHR